MFTPREMAAAAEEDVNIVTDARAAMLRDMGFEVRLAGSGGTRPSMRLEVDQGDGTGWTEYVESACTRGAHAFDAEFLRSLRRNGWIVLHYPVALIDERFARLKAEELLFLALDSGMDHAEVWVYLYDRRGGEARVV